MDTEDPQTKPLREWNRLAREGAENAIVSSMFEAGMLASEPVEKFATWLLVGTAFILSFLITNANHLLPIIGHNGFRTLGGLLCASCLFGVVSRVYALRCKIQSAVAKAVGETFAERLEAYSKEEKKIQDGAKFWGITLETGVRMERIMGEFFKPLPKLAVWLATRQLKKNEGNPQIAYLTLIKSLTRQSIFAFLQALMFFIFFVFGVIYASSI